MDGGRWIDSTYESVFIRRREELEDDMAWKVVKEVVAAVKINNVPPLSEKREVSQLYERIFGSERAQKKKKNFLRK